MKKNHSHHAAEKVQQYIQINGLASGDKLPPEKDLTKLLEVGRSSLREGLRMLEGMRLVKVLAGKGTYVDQLNPPPIALPLVTGADSVLQMLDVRHMIELGAITLAIQYATTEDVENIRSALEEMEESDRQDTRSTVASAADLRFHKKIYESTHNPIFMQVIDSISENYYKFWAAEMAGMFSATLKYHRLIYLAILSRDLKAAQIVTADMMQVMKDSVKFLAFASGKDTISQT